MSVKVRISYEKPQELHAVLKMLNPVIVSYKVEKRQNGAYRRVYVEISIPEENATEMHRNAQIRR